MTREEIIESPEQYREKIKQDIAMLISMLEYKRPHGSKSERRFINRFIRPLGTATDDYGNHYLRVGSETPRILWSAHTDSVHRIPGRQHVVLDGGLAKLAPLEKSNCLGADNAAGVWLLTELIKAGVPGLYVFHRNEESGCRGAHHLARNSKELLSGIEMAIAFDRRGTKSIITHQMSERTCSDTFAKSLRDAISLGHELDDGGSYTDTSAYSDIIPECTNVSVGYLSEHSSNEQLNVGYLLLLRAALVDADLSRLVVARDPSVKEFDHWGGYGSWGRGYTGHRGGWSIDNDRQPSMFPRPAYAHRHADLDECRDLIDLCNEFPDEVADYLEMMGVDPLKLADHIAQVLGYDKCAN